VRADGTAEIGGNAGSNFKIDRHDDAGNGIASALLIQRTTGNVGIGTDNPTSRLHVAGTVTTEVLQVNGADLSEKFEIGEALTL
jgi:hypothetical protein